MVKARISDPLIVTRSRIPISKNTPKLIQETADSMFGDKEFLPLQTFIHRMGMDRKTVLKLIGDELLDVFQYQSNKYRIPSSVSTIFNLHR